MTDEEHLRSQCLTWGQTVAKKIAKHIEPGITEEAYARLMRVLNRVLCDATYAFVKTNGASAAQVGEGADLAGVRATFPDFDPRPSGSARED